MVVSVTIIGPRIIQLEQKELYSYKSYRIVYERIQLFISKVVHQFIEIRNYFRRESLTFKVIFLLSHNETLSFTNSISLVK